MSTVKTEQLESPQNYSLNGSHGFKRLEPKEYLCECGEERAWDEKKCEGCLEKERTALDVDEG